MPRKSDVPCADCGRMLVTGKGSLPAGKRCCRPCRQVRMAGRICHCGKALTRTQPTYCSRLCANARPGTRPGAKTNRVCEMCGVAYRSSYHEQRTCGRACGSWISKRTIVVSDVEWRECRVCALPYTLSGRRRCGCSLTVKTGGGGGVRSTACRDCDAPFPNVIISTYPARCATCRQERRRDERKRRKALRRGAQVEPVSVVAVYERDRWRCGLCGRKVDKRLKYPHKRSASLDHVVPLAHGGAHSMANVQLAHLACNVEKSDGGSQQLALVG